MSDEIPPTATRRRLLQAGSTLGLAALAGCSGDDDSDPVPTQDVPRFDPRRPALYFYSEVHSEIFSTDNLFTYDRLDELTTVDEYPNSDAFATTFSEEELAIEFEAVVTRPVTLAVNLLAPTFPHSVATTDSAFPEDNPHSFTVDLEPDVTERELRNSVVHEHLRSYRFTFDVPDVDFPENVAVRAHFCLFDEHGESAAPFVLKRHAEMQLAYYVGDERRRRWMRRSPNIAERNRAGRWLPGNHYQFEEEGYTVTHFVAHENRGNEYWAASHTVDTAELEDYGANGEGGWLRHCIREANSAHRKPHMRRLARGIWDAQTRAGITDPVQRINGVARLVGNIPYERSGAEGARKPAYVLFDQRGNCSEKTYLFAGILRCPPFETRVGYIYCTLDGEAHAAAGVEVDAFEDTSYDIDDHEILRPHDFEDTPEDHYAGEFSFIDVTSYTPLGTFRPNRYDLDHFYGTNFASDHDWEYAEA